MKVTMNENDVRTLESGAKTRLPLPRRLLAAMRADDAKVK